ncbi:oleate hydratase [Candidatus Parcubacteria bacterium]|nr:MAG: oleate hydratase [Candidatus Parcubacteria bacterium]
MALENRKDKIYLVGGGIASLSATFFLLEDAMVPGENITIIDSGKLMGGSLDGEMQNESGAYIMRGHRILDSRTFECTFAMLDRIESKIEKGKSIKKEIMDFNEKVKTHTLARLVERGKVVDSHSLGLNKKQRKLLAKLFLYQEKNITDLRINDYFDDGFFKTNFWLEFATTFAFQPWHSLIEFKRYILRSFHALKYYDTMDCIIVPPYCYHDSIVMPLIHYLRERKVNFMNKTRVIDLELNETDDKVLKIILDSGLIDLNEDDKVIATIGSMTAHSSFGSNKNSINNHNYTKDNAWEFWERLASKNFDFGNPRVFDDHEYRSNWMSFSITFKNSLFFDKMEKLTGNKTGTSGGTTLKRSNWFMSIGLPHQPHFLNQDKSIQVAWGYALSPKNKGDFVAKSMLECSGEEILTELCYHLGFEDDLEKILASAITIPVYMPMITSQFSLRKIEDRPQVIPGSINNLAFIGQYVEIPGDISFTVEYSVRSAQMAVYGLFGIKKKIPKIYKGYRNIFNILSVTKTIFR